MSGRKGNRVLAGEDTELCFALRASGWRLWYDDDLTLRHFIPKGRLQWDYALRLSRGIGESSILIVVYLCALNAPPFDRYPTWKRTWLFQTLKALQHYVRGLLFHPVACLQKQEGSPVLLDSEQLKSRLATLWTLRGKYEKLQDTIRQAAWVKVK